MQLHNAMSVIQRLPVSVVPEFNTCCPIIQEIRSFIGQRSIDCCQQVCCQVLYRLSSPLAAHNVAGTLELGGGCKL